MNRRFVRLSMFSVFSFVPALCLAGALESVCSTDTQTLESIKTDSDQTIWLFMQLTCKGEFIVSPGYLRSNLQKESEAETVLLEGKSSKDKNSEILVSLPAIEPGNPSVQVAKNPIDHTEGLSSSDLTNRVHVDKFKVNEPESRFVSSDEFVTSVNTDESDLKTGSVSRGQISVPSALMDDPPASPDSAKYALVASINDHHDDRPLPLPIEYEPNRFSSYVSKDTVPLLAANNQSGLLLQRPDIMRNSPYGAYGFLNWHSYEEPGLMRQSGPMAGLGFVDERAIREWKIFPGFGSRFELGRGWVKYKGTGELTNQNIYALAEMYMPISDGFFVGLGYRRYLDDKVPDDLPYGYGVLSSTGARAYDRISDYFYLPLGVAASSEDGSTFKVQFNYLIKGRQLSKLTQTYRYDDLVNTQRKGWGLDLAYSINPKTEFFLRYWNIEKSDIKALRRSGTPTGGFGWEPANTTLEGGVRGWW